MILRKIMIRWSQSYDASWKYDGFYLQTLPWAHVMLIKQPCRLQQLNVWAFLASWSQFACTFASLLSIRGGFPTVAYIFLLLLLKFAYGFLNNKQLKALSQTFILLVIASISLLLQKSEWWRMEMTSQITTLLELVHYPTKKFEYRNQMETIHIIIKYM